MKTPLFLCLSVLAYSCVTDKELQMDIVEVELIKIDTVRRYTFDEKVLTWRADNKIDFVTFAPISENYAVGSRLKMLIRR